MHIRVEYTGRGLPLSREQEAAQAEALKRLCEVPGVVHLFEQLYDYDEELQNASQEAFNAGIAYALEYMCDAVTAKATGLSFQSVRQAGATYHLVDEG